MTFIPKHEWIKLQQRLKQKDVPKREREDIEFRLRRAEASLLAGGPRYRFRGVYS